MIYKDMDYLFFWYHLAFLGIRFQRYLVLIVIQFCLFFAKCAQHDDFHKLIYSNNVNLFSIIPRLSKFSKYLATT